MKEREYEAIQGDTVSEQEVVEAAARMLHEQMTLYRKPLGYVSLERAAYWELYDHEYEKITRIVLAASRWGLLAKETTEPDDKVPTHKLKGVVSVVQGPHSPLASYGRGVAGGSGTVSIDDVSPCEYAPCRLHLAAKTILTQLSRIVKWLTDAL